MGLIVCNLESQTSHIVLNYNNATNHALRFNHRRQHIETQGGPLPSSSTRSLQLFASPPPRLKSHRKLMVTLGWSEAFGGIVVLAPLVFHSSRSWGAYIRISCRIMARWLVTTYSLQPFITFFFRTSAAYSPVKRDNHLTCPSWTHLSHPKHEWIDRMMQHKLTCHHARHIWRIQTTNGLVEWWSIIENVLHVLHIWRVPATDVLVEVLLITK